MSPPAQSPVSFQAGLEKLLANDREIFLLISRFEHSSRETQEELAAILRSLGERFARSLRVVIRGAERLYELAYVGPYQPYLDDPLLKELYWKNRLQKDQNGSRLTWRSEALRLATLKIISPCLVPSQAGTTLQTTFVNSGLPD